METLTEELKPVALRHFEFELQLNNNYSETLLLS